MRSRGVRNADVSRTQRGPPSAAAARTTTREQQLGLPPARRVPIEVFRAEMERRALGWRGVEHGDTRRAEVESAVAEATEAPPTQIVAALEQALCFPVAAPLQAIDADAEEGDKASATLSFGDYDCTICQSPMEYGDDPKELPRELPCRHVYHGTCLSSWLLRSVSCPMCRRELHADIAQESAKTRQAEGAKKNMNRNARREVSCTVL